METQAEFYTVNDLAKKLNCSTGLIYSQVNSGALPHIRLGKAVRFPVKPTDEHIDKLWQSSYNTATDAGISTSPIDEAGGAERFQHTLMTKI